MAESGIQAFGRYLRTLRKRRNLSMQDVCSLSQAFAETLNKGYLSRCENGRQSLALPKVIPLGRIYCVSADVLLERLELDLELDRVGGPDTEGMSFAELTKAGTEALNQGYNWNAYGLLRDAVVCASEAEVASRYRDREEQIACAYMNCATATRYLGRRRFALHEYKFLEKLSTLGPRIRPILLERLSQSYRSLDQLDLAISYSVTAIAAAEELGDVDRLGIVYSNRAQLSVAKTDLDGASAYFQKAYEAFKSVGRNHECIRSLNNLAQVYFDLGRVGASRRALLAADKLALPLGLHRARALGHILMGEIEQSRQKEALATKCWKEAAELAKTLDDKVLRFKAEFFLYKQAQGQDNLPVARALLRRLRRLSNWVPSDTAELVDFRQLAEQHTVASR